ncbi:hypothetical protein [Aquicoccus porphyridii]|uniref:hypothetical protein n=1 Tax=Aquicoccus porphyridii TaxID=1852029 RepID=UPI00273FCEC7|nr:hypothetical protein [Aquicoccus porphyridii]
MRFSHIIGGALIAALLAGCGITDRARANRVAFDGVEFRPRSQQVGEAREEFAITVPRASQSLVGARAAGAHEATRYCIENFGRSDLEWEIGPEDEELLIENGTLTLRGRCDGW